MNSVSEILKQRRTQTGLSISDVVEHLSREHNITVSSKTVYGWENGASYPKIDIFVILCNLYGISTDDFLEVAKKASFHTVKISNEENSMLLNFRRLDERGKTAVKDTLAREMKYAGVKNLDQIEDSKLIATDIANTIKGIEESELHLSQQSHTAKK